MLALAGCIAANKPVHATAVQLDSTDVLVMHMPVALSWMGKD